MIDITLAKHEDMYEVADLVIGAFGTETCVKIPALGDPKTASKMMFIERYLDFINKKNPYMCYIARKDGELIGAVAGYTFVYQWAPQIWGSEDFWYVKKEYRGGSTGVKLFNKLMNWFDELKVDKICMMHYSWNEKVGDFYEKNGFYNYETSYVKDMKG